MNIILIGFKNCGKSTVGALLAKTLKYDECIDTDKVLRNLYETEHQVKLSIPEIHQKEGDDSFRQWEGRVLTTFAAADNKVIATGGGIILRGENRALLKKIGKVIYLRASAEELLQRQNNTRIPAFVDKNNPVNSFMQVFNTRKPIYEQNADYIIDVDNKHAPDVVEEILHCIPSLSSL